MPRPEDLREIVPGTVSEPWGDSNRYWLRGRTVMFGDDEMRQADPDSFKFYLNGFAKDRKYCYSGGRVLRGGNGPTLRALNYCYATDGRFVWTMGGAVKDADAESFEVCDDGVYNMDGLLSPYGYGKDRSRVYYYDADGTPNVVRKATDPKTFQSLNDGHFAQDHQFMYCSGQVLPGANPKTWRRMESFYSKDDRRIYYLNRHIKAADYDSFEVLPTAQLFSIFARDKNNCYVNDEIAPADEFEKYLATARN